MATSRRAKNVTLKAKGCTLGLGTLRGRGTSTRMLSGGVDSLHGTGGGRMT